MVNYSFTFNPAQLCTYCEAKELAQMLGNAVGGGVKPETNDQNTSGIYIPTWLPGPSDFQVPHIVAEDGTVSWFFHFRFMNGADGMNCGLMLDMFKRYPTAPGYVITQLAGECAMIAAGK